jgi:hypothetical protein
MYYIYGAPSSNSEMEMVLTPDKPKRLVFEL